MERGLLWLPLLAVFIGLAWAGWHEFQKLEAYQRWAADWERAKYDLYAVVGQRGSTLTWGQPTRQGPVVCQTLDLGTVVAIFSASANGPGTQGLSGVHPSPRSGWGRL